MKSKFESKMMDRKMANDGNVQNRNNKSQLDKKKWRRTMNGQKQMAGTKWNMNNRDAYLYK